jgi:signal transduction histidine kinase
MALRAFRCNPALGGFGNETGLSYLLNEAGEKATEGKSQQKQNPLVVRDGGSGDAFAQILKELVDNAVDACGHCLDSADNTNAVKRVRVSIESVGTSASDKADNTARTENDNSDRELLRVEVNDNGCGMDDIEKYVSAFNSSKGDNDLEGIDSHRIETAGRYGIGLTLVRKTQRMRSHLFPHR